MLAWVCSSRSGRESGRRVSARHGGGESQGARRRRRRADYLCCRSTTDERIHTGARGMLGRRGSDTGARRRRRAANWEGMGADRRRRRGSGLTRSSHDVVGGMEERRGADDPGIEASPWFCRTATGPCTASTPWARGPALGSDRRETTRAPRWTNRVMRRVRPIPGTRPEQAPAGSDTTRRAIAEGGIQRPHTGSEGEGEGGGGRGNVPWAALGPGRGSRGAGNEPRPAHKMGLPSFLHPCPGAVLDGEDGDEAADHRHRQRDGRHVLGPPAEGDGTGGPGEARGGLRIGPRSWPILGRRGPRIRGPTGYNAPRRDRHEVASRSRMVPPWALVPLAVGAQTPLRAALVRPRGFRGRVRVEVPGGGGVGGGGGRLPRLARSVGDPPTDLLTGAHFQGYRVRRFATGVHQFWGNSCDHCGSCDLPNVDPSGR